MFSAKSAVSTQQSSQRAGNDGSGGIELQVNQQAAKDQDQHGKIRVHQAVEEPFAQGWLNLDQFRIPGMKRYGVAVESLDGAAIQRVEQLAVTRCNEVDEMKLLGFVLRVGLRVEHGILGGIRIAIAQ